MTDRFGEVMLFNLKGRGCALAGVEACASLNSQEERFYSTYRYMIIENVTKHLLFRFVQASWDGAKAWEMTQVYQSLPRNEIQRIERIEFLDEKELLDQLFHHYCISIAWKDGCGMDLGSIELG